MRMSRASPEALHAQLRELAENEPSFEQSTPELARWLGRLHDAIVLSDGGSDAISVKVAGDNLLGLLAEENGQTVRNALYRALARVERALPEEAQGGFIAAGDVFDALTIIASALGEAVFRVLIIDPYMSPDVLFKYAKLVPERVSVDLLGAQGRIKDALIPSAEAWIEQYGDRRPIRVRQVDPRLLHDRLLLVDDREVWDISQSLNAIAKRSHATISRVRFDQAALKVEAYSSIFSDADVII